MSNPLSDHDIEVTPEQTQERLAAGDVVVIDVREQYEVDAGRIDGTRHIEIERLASQAETLDKDTPIVFTCRLGSRSMMAAQAFRRAGYEAYSMAGGIQRWVEENRPITPEDGAVADH
jgi:hydroxyacylglutathione hydrolase/adenylyltransferase/sulfurtransferase